MFCSDDVILVTREGWLAGFFLPGNAPELPKDVQREAFLRLTDQIAAQRAARGVTEEEEVLSDFAAARRRR